MSFYYNPEKNTTKKLCDSSLKQIFETSFRDYCVLRSMERTHQNPMYPVPINVCAKYNHFSLQLWSLTSKLEDEIVILQACELYITKLQHILCSVQLVVCLCNLQQRAQKEKSWFPREDFEQEVSKCQWPAVVRECEGASVEKGRNCINMARICSSGGDSACCLQSPPVGPFETGGL